MMLEGGEFEFGLVDPGRRCLLCYCQEGEVLACKIDDGVLSECIIMNRLIFSITDDVSVTGYKRAYAL